MASRCKARRLLLTSVDWQTVLVEVGTCPAARRPIGSVSDLTDFVTKQSKNLSISPALLATKWFCGKLIDIGTDCYHDDRVTEPSRLEIENILELGCYLKENSLIDYRCLIDIIQKDVSSIGVYILWKLTNGSIIDIKDIIDCSNEWHSDMVCTVVANSLVKLSHMLDSPVYRNDLLDDIAIVVMEIYAGDNNEGLWKPAAEKILLKVLDGSYFVSGNPPCESFHSVLHASSRLSPIANKRLFTRLLHHFVLLPPLTSVVECYPHQSDYQFSSLSDLKRSLFVTVCIGMDASLCWSTIMDLFKTHKKLNWSVVLSLVACFVHHYSETVILKDLISDVVQSAFVETTPTLNEPLLYGAMAVARQASLEGSHVFPSYSDWFKETFSDVPGCVIQNKKDLGCLLKCLTAMVPFDPPYCLRAHLQHHPRKLSKCQLMVKEYMDLVHTRLEELNEPFSELVVNGCGDGSTVITELALADADVDEVIKEYESHDCHVIPSKVLELSMFRQPYFIGKFLKSLLAPRKLPGVPDTRTKLISALEKQGTIPLKYMNKYRTECSKITSNDGVTLGESTPPLYSLLVSELQRVLRHINDDAASFKGVLSHLSNCISSTIKDAQRHYSTSLSSTSTVLDLSSPGIQKHTLEIINYIVTNLCECIFKLYTQLTNEDSVPLTHFNSITMFVRMLSGHVTLHRGLLVRLWELVHLQVTELADEQLLSLAVLIAQLYANECLYSTITVKLCCMTFCDSKNNIIEVTNSMEYAELLVSSLLHYNHTAMINTGKFLCHMLYHLYTRQYNIESINNGSKLSCLKQCVVKLQYFQERITCHQRHVKSIQEDMNGLLKMIAPVLEEFKISSCQAGLIMKLQFDFMSQDYLSPLQRHKFRRDMLQSAGRNCFANLFCFMLKLTSSGPFCCSAHKEIHNRLMAEGSIEGIQLLLELSPGLGNVCDEEDHVPLKFLLDFEEIDNEETVGRCVNFIQALPPYICYSGSVVELPSEKQLTTFVKIMKRIMTSLCCHGILLPFDLTCHLFKGISQFSLATSSNRFNHLCDIYPVFHASILFWWNNLKEHVSGSILNIEAFHIFNIAVLDIQQGSIQSSPYLLSHCKAVAICTAGLICTLSSKDISTERFLQELKLPSTSYSQSLLCYLGKCCVNILLKDIPVLYRLTTTAMECPAITVLQYILTVDVSLWVVLLHEEHYASVGKMNQLNQFSKDLPMDQPAYRYNLLLLIVLSYCNDCIIKKLTQESGFLQKFLIAHKYLFDTERHCIHMDNFLKSCSVLTRTIVMNASKQKLQDCLPFCHKGLQMYLEHSGLTV